MTNLENFIWVGQHAINMNCIVRFSIEDDGRRVSVLLKNVEVDRTRITVEGDEAMRLIRALNDGVNIGAISEIFPDHSPCDPIHAPARILSDDEVSGSDEVEIGLDTLIGR